MRLIKMLGLAAVAAMAAMAFVGATSASATSTQLCNSHDALTCDSGEAATNVDMLGHGTLLADFITVLCDLVNVDATPLGGLGSGAQAVDGLVAYESCETQDEDPCVVEHTTNTANLLKTGLNLGTLTATDGSSLISCEDVIFGIDIHCTYDATGLQFTIAHGHVDVDNVTVQQIGDLEFCPEESVIHGLLDMTTERYILA